MTSHSDIGAVGKMSAMLETDCPAKYLAKKTVQPDTRGTEQLSLCETDRNLLKSRIQVGIFVHNEKCTQSRFTKHGSEENCTQQKRDIKKVVQRDF